MEPKRYPKGHFIGLGITIGIPLGMPIGFAIGNIAFGPAIGLALGIPIGIALEKKKNPIPRELTKEEQHRKQRGLLLLFVLGLILLTVLFVLNIF